MSVQVTLYSILKRYAGDTQGQIQMPFIAGEDVAGLLERLGIARFEVLLIILNGKTSPLEQTLQQGDRVDIYPPMSGG